MLIKRNTDVSKNARFSYIPSAAPGTAPAGVFLRVGSRRVWCNYAAEYAARAPGMWQRYAVGYAAGGRGFGYRHISFRRGAGGGRVAAW